jgi:hypothetical protein
MILSVWNSSQARCDGLLRVQSSLEATACFCLNSVVVATLSIAEANSGEKLGVFAPPQV